MERINIGNACHFFMACRDDRPLAEYAIDLASAQGVDAVPHFRYRCGVEGSKVYRPDWQRTLSDQQRKLVTLVDGRRSIRQIIAQINAGHSDSGRSDEQQIDDVLLFIQSLVDRDFIALGIQP